MKFSRNGLVTSFDSLFCFNPIGIAYSPFVFTFLYLVRNNLLLIITTFPYVSVFVSPSDGFQYIRLARHVTIHNF
jgi:hypothetical protein